MTINEATKTIYDDLTERVEAAAPIVQKIAQLRKDIESGRFSDKAIKDELTPALSNASVQLSRAKDEAKLSTQRLVNQCIEALKDEDTLNPADLTDDVKLLTSGLQLTPRDIKVMLERNKTNRTMSLAILRYAREHDIETGTVYVGNEQHIAALREFPSLVNAYVDHYMGMADAREMLTRMFGI